MRKLNDAERQTARRLQNQLRVNPFLNLRNVRIAYFHRGDEVFAVLQHNNQTAAGRAKFNPKDRDNGVKYNPEVGERIAFGRALRNL